MSAIFIFNVFACTVIAYSINSGIIMQVGNSYICKFLVISHKFLHSNYMKQAIIILL
jgi:hypothetical protein